MIQLRRTMLVLTGALLVGLFVASPLLSADDQTPERLVIAEAGTLPVLITAPHGGTKPVPNVAVREERPGDRVNLRRDEMTNRLAVLTADELEKRVGKRPYLVVAEFTRKAIDANRPEDTAYQQRAAAPYYRAYHEAVARYAQEIRRDWKHGLLIDLHAQWLRPDAIMRGTRDGQTIQGLLNRRGWDGVLGNDGVMGALAEQGVPLFPPAGEGEGQWTHQGSVTVVKYGRDGIDGLQLEIGSNLCDSEEDVQRLARQLAIGLERHLKAERQLSSTLRNTDLSLTAFVDPEADSEEETEAANDQDASGTPLNDAEQAFVDLLTGSVLVGRFSIDAAWDENPKTERYAISRVAKVGEDNWIVQARITYGKHDVTVPVPVKVHWAGDTPVISLTDLKIPGLGEGFTTRVLFYEDRYAGSWYHGKVGGHMWGRIEKNGAAETDNAEKKP